MVKRCFLILTTSLKSLPDSHLDLAVIAILAADPNTATIEPYGQAGFSTPSKISIVIDGKTSVY